MIASIASSFPISNATPGACFKAFFTIFLFISPPIYFPSLKIIPTVPKIFEMDSPFKTTVYSSISLITAIAGILSNLDTSPLKTTSTLLPRFEGFSYMLKISP